jgi:hypothetical protein
VYVENGIAKPDKSSPTSTKFQVSCNPGFSLAKNAKSKVKCTIDENGSEVSFTCKRDLILRGTGTATCGVMGWENLPLCLDVDEAKLMDDGGSAAKGIYLHGMITLTLSLLFLFL